MRVKVVKIHPLENPEGESGEKKLEGACDSPSSDKENTSQENQRKEPPPLEEENRRESLSKYQSIQNGPFKISHLSAWILLFQQTRHLNLYLF